MHIAGDKYLLSIDEQRDGFLKIEKRKEVYKILKENITYQEKL